MKRLNYNPSNNSNSWQCTKCCWTNFSDYRAFSNHKRVHSNSHNYTRNNLPKRSNGNFGCITQTESTDDESSQNYLPIASKKKSEILHSSISPTKNVQLPAFKRRFLSQTKFSTPHPTDNPLGRNDMNNSSFNSSQNEIGLSSKLSLGKVGSILTSSCRVRGCRVIGCVCHYY